MTNAARFEVCMQRAKASVSSYRNECPEGIDPKATWVAVGTVAVGAVVTAGSQAYAGQQQKKAAKGAAAALQSPAQFVPETLNPKQILGETYEDVYQGLGQAKDITAKLNRFDYRQALKYLNLIQPGFTGIQQQIGQNALSFARGELPSDVVGSITRAAAQQGQQGGFAAGGGGAAPGMLRNLNLRNLGLTSLDLSKYGTQVGMQVNQSAKSLLPNLGSVRDWLLSLPQQTAIAQYNTDWINKAGLVNTQSALGAQQANAQGILQSGLTDAATTAGIGQTVGGAISGAGSLFGVGSIGQPQGTYMGSFATNPEPGVQNRIYRPTYAKLA